MALLRSSSATPPSAAAKPAAEPAAEPAAAAAEPEPACEWQFAALQFDAPLHAPLGSLVIGSRLDAGGAGAAGAAGCRIAFFGRLVAALPPPRAAGEHPLAALRLFKRKLKVGTVDRVDGDGGGGGGGGGDTVLVGRGLFRKGADAGRFAGLALRTRGGARGVLEGAFGKAGKFKARFASAAAGAPPPPRAGDELLLAYKKYLFGGGPAGIVQDDD